jgi:biotin transporter BioY
LALEARLGSGLRQFDRGDALDTALSFELYPFIIGDTVKLLLAAGLLPAASRLLERLRPEGEGPGVAH